MVYVGACWHVVVLGRLMLMVGGVCWHVVACEFGPLAQAPARPYHNDKNPGVPRNMHMPSGCGGGGGGSD